MNKIIQFIKEFGTATYQISTDSIIGCEKGSICYRHEEGHRNFTKYHNSLRIQLSSYHYLSFFTGAGLLAFDYKIIAEVLIVMAALCLGVEEIYAWVYAIQSSVIRGKQNGN
jgi:hypothetical protein